MCDFTLVALEFDDAIGPRIKSIDGPLVFTDSDLLAIQMSSFPESMIHLSTPFHFYSFIVSSFHCHCAFLQQRSDSAARGSHLFAVVIASERGWFEPIFDLFRSIRFILTQPLSEIMNLLKSVFRIWISVLSDIHEPYCDLPLFTGLQRYSYQFDSIVGTMFLEEIDAQCNLQNLWESLILNEPVIVFGSTPSVASRVVRLLAAVLVPFSASSVSPYVPITHPQFRRIAKNPIGIIGVTNPIALSFIEKPVKLLKVGFCRASPNSRTIQKCLSLMKMSRDLAAAVHDSLTDMEKSEPVSLLQKQMNITFLIQRMTINGISTSMPLRDFAMKFVAAPVFVKPYRKSLAAAEKRSVQ
jgi:hypothetical protein